MTAPMIARRLVETHGAARAYDLAVARRTKRGIEYRETDDLKAARRVIVWDVVAEYIRRKYGRSA